MIDLDAPGAILFFGTMNAMPMSYARELKRLNQNVIYFVDVPKNNTLCRPENHFPEIDYPYPDWIIECILPSPLIASTLPKWTLNLMLAKVRAKVNGLDIKAAFMSGTFVSFIPHLPLATFKIFLSYGSDLDTWCDTRNTLALNAGMRSHSVFRFLPNTLSRMLVEKIVYQNIYSAKKADAFIYFPKGLNKVGDRIIGELEAAGVRYIPRFDVSFAQLMRVERGFKEPGSKLIIFAVVRFLYKTFTEPNEEYTKGNDIIIRGLAMYARENRDIEIRFVEKGPDVGNAKALCDELGLSKYVVWYKEMPYKDLVRHFEEADICFDQVGKHWIGAGIYGMYIGRPLIANVRNLRFLGDTPVMNAETPNEVFQCLVALSNREFRKTVAEQSMRFAERNFGQAAVLEKLVANYS